MSEPRHRHTVSLVADSLPSPPAVWREAAQKGTASQTRHYSLMQEAPCLDRLRVVQPAGASAPPSLLRVAAWNLERCKFPAESAAVLRKLDVDLCLLTEMDLGMARSGNRDTTAELAEALAMGHAFGVEFIELGHGNGREQADHGAVPNMAGLHGNTVATRLPIDRAVVMPLDPGGAWFTDDADNDQRRIGGRMAVALRHRVPEPLWFIAAHYESRLGPNDREKETQNLLSQIAVVCGDDPVLLGGDFNCKALQEAGLTAEETLSQPETAEPMFARLAEAGFDWQACNTAEVTTRLHPWHDSASPLKKIDWFFARGLACNQPRVIPAVDTKGENLSDHEIILVDITW